ncbi:GNAT family N-acetyltransferase [Paenibacillus gorillae]|uniref:GNAT family N-acetyltransferase n=1 Tax=Paenibacillus gorillae TaxID=1243662 RepID=UPI001EE2A175|nr:GNAT family N-acetyltransferase [Paenibacillus gorillae]
MKSLLSECMWTDEERVHAELIKYLEDDTRELYGRFLNDQLVGLIGIVYDSIGEVELKHIAIKSDYRGKGLGRQFIHDYMKVKEIVKMKAETDKDAVGFYTKLGFSIMSLGEKYPGVERFECTLLRHKESS